MNDRNTVRWLIAGVGLLACGLGVVRVQQLTAAERVVGSGWREIAPSDPEGHPSPLGQVVLSPGQRVYFDLCIDAVSMADAHLNVWKASVWHGEHDHLVARTLDPSHMRRIDDTGTYCQRIAQSEGVQEAGSFSLRVGNAPHAEPTTVLRATAQIRIEQPLDRSHHIPVWMLWLAMAAAVILRFDPRALVPVLLYPVGLWRLIAAVGALGMALLSSIYLPGQGAIGALISGLWLGGIQVTAAFVLSYPQSRALLGLVPPRAVARAAFAAVMIGAGLVPLGSRLMSWWPVPDDTPIVALAAWPSGTLAVALVGVALPVAEELFFRGLIFGTAAARWGRGAAFVLTTALFMAAHLPQVAGAWGAVAAIGATGVALTALRSWTGSSLPAILAHLVHNGCIAALTLY